MMAQPFAGHGPRFLGILNLTPDSFSDGGRWLVPEAALAQAHKLVLGGVSALDIGAESTRPGAEPLDPGTEWDRLEPVLKALRMEFPDLPLSLDTRHPEVAARGLDLGVRILNDVTGFRNPDMLRLAREGTCTLIAMRARLAGEAFLMPPYEGTGQTTPNLALEELREVRDRLLGAGIDPERIVLDPGFGFGTTWVEDRSLWESLETLPHRLEWPIARFCLGISRKRFTAWWAGRPDLPPLARDGFTHELHRKAQSLGFRIFRTHALPLTDEVTHD